MLGSTMCNVHAGALRGGHTTRQQHVLQPRRFVSVPSMLCVGSILNAGDVRARFDMLVSLVISYDQIASARRVEAMWEGCQRLAPHVV